MGLGVDIRRRATKSLFCTIKDQANKGKKNPCISWWISGLLSRFSAGQTGNPSPVCPWQCPDSSTYINVALRAPNDVFCSGTEALQTLGSAGVGLQPLPDGSMVPV